MLLWYIRYTAQYYENIIYIFRKVLFSMVASKLELFRELLYILHVKLKGVRFAYVIAHSVERELYNASHTSLCTFLFIAHASGANKSTYVQHDIRLLVEKPGRR